MFSLLAALATVALATPSFADDALWSAWKQDYAREYSTVEEESYRAYVFAENWKVIKAHPANASYSLGLNKFADLTTNEWRARYVGGYRPASSSPPSLQTQAPFVGDLPDSVDWVAKGAVTPIKNQGQCGSCWAFSTTGGIEGINFINTGNLVSLSEQQLVDCAGNGNEGCNGGDSRWAAHWIIKDHPAGLCTEADYPYTGKTGKCEENKCTPAVTINGIIKVDKNNATALMAALVSAPQSVAVDAASSKWQFYTGGVMDSKCGDSLDHAVLAVGYGTMGEKPYFTIKNSWGADWGAKGYILLGRDTSDEHGECGVLKEVTGYTQAS